MRFSPVSSTQNSPSGGKAPSMEWVHATELPVVLPEGLLLGVGLPVSGEHVGRDHSQVATGSVELLHEFVAERLRQAGESFTRLTLHRHASGKPYARVDDRVLGLSITHTRTRLWCAVNRLGETGIDAEPADRKVVPALHKRILHPDEQVLTDSGVGAVQLWTIKEAILKYTGTGLRKAMCRVCVKRLSQYGFSAVVDGSALYICSFECRNHWVSVAVQQQAHPPESYPPGQGHESQVQAPESAHPPESHPPGPGHESQVQAPDSTHPPESHPPKPFTS